MSEILADADGVTPLFHRGISDDLRQSPIRTFKSKSRNPHLRMNVDFLIGCSFDGDVACSVRQFQPNGPRDVQSALEVASRGRSKGATRKEQSDGEKSQR